MLMAELKGREALTRRLQQIAPNVEKYAAEAKLEIAEDAAEAISEVAPIGHGAHGGEYAASIKADFVRNFPHQEQVGINATKDKDATGVRANFIWRFLEFGTKAHNVAKGGGRASGIEALATGRKTKLGVKPIMHPGTSPQPHVFTTWRAMKKKARRKLLAAVNKGVREAMGKK